MSQHQLLQFVTDLLPSWRKSRRKVLALGASGLLRRRRLTLCGIARGLDSSTRVLYRVKRLWRFIDNDAVWPHDVVAALVREAFAVRREGWVPIILDETGLEDRALLLGAATSYRGRALPLALYAYNARSIKRSVWILREGLIALIRQSLPPEQRSRLLLIADRGYAASHFFRRLIRARVQFVIRVPRRVLLYMAHQTHRLEHLAADLKPGDCIFLTDISYGPAKATLNLLLWWEADQQEPWLLATTLTSAVEARRSYKQRMQIEELFKDLKGCFALEACRCTTLDRITRMALFLLISLWALALLVRYPAQFVRFITARGKLSFLSLALEWLFAPPWLRRQIRQEAQTG
jgi:hypothetical protein